jgi:hypothetical protein
MFQLPPGVSKFKNSKILDNKKLKKRRKERTKKRKKGKKEGRKKI